MNYIKITKNDIANGEGVRVVLWLSGCSHNCKGCHNPQTHSPKSGTLFDENAKNELFEALERPYVSGITFSGGDPLNENNLQGVLSLIEKIRKALPDKTIWIYTGYTWEEVWEPKRRLDVSGQNIVGWTIEQSIRQDIIRQCDVLVDGRYEEDKRDITLRWRGSSNQRVIDVQQSTKDNKVVLYCQ